MVSAVPKHFLKKKWSQGLDHELQDCALQLSDDGALTYNLQFGVRIFPDAVHTYTVPRIMGV